MWICYFVLKCFSRQPDVIFIVTLICSHFLFPLFSTFLIILINPIFLFRSKQLACRPAQDRSVVPTVTFWKAKSLNFTWRRFAPRKKSKFGPQQSAIGSSMSSTFLSHWLSLFSSFLYSSTSNFQLYFAHFLFNLNRSFLLVWAFVK